MYCVVFVLVGEGRNVKGSKLCGITNISFARRGGSRSLDANCGARACVHHSKTKATTFFVT